MLGLPGTKSGRHAKRTSTSGIRAVSNRTYAEIATALFISEKTVSVHISNMLRKTGTRSRRELAALATRLAWTPPVTDLDARDNTQAADATTSRPIPIARSPPSAVAVGEHHKAISRLQCLRRNGAPGAAGHRN